MRSFSISAIFLLCWSLLLGFSWWNAQEMRDLQRIRQAYDRKDIVTSLRLACDYVDRHPNHAEAALIAARCLSARVFPREAERYYQIAERGGALSLEDEHRRALGWARTRLPEEAAARYQAILAAHPDDALAMRRFAALEWGRGRPDEASRWAKALTEHPDPKEQAAGWELLSGYLRERGDRAASAEARERLVKLDPELNGLSRPKLEFWREFAGDLILLGRHDQAAEWLANSARAETSGDPDLLDLLGICRFQQSRDAEAERLFRRSMNINEDRATPWLYWGRLALRRNRPADAAERLEIANRLLPDHYEIVYNLSVALQMLGRTEQAAQWREKAERLRSDSSSSRPSDSKSGTSPPSASL